LEYSLNHSIEALGVRRSPNLRPPGALPGAEGLLARQLRARQRIVRADQRQPVPAV